MADAARIDDDVRMFVYRRFVDEGRPPVPAEIAHGLGIEIREAEASLRRLADAHVLVLAPGTPYVWMANPLSALPTPFQVEVNDRRWFANCIWDSLGVAAMLDAGARVRTWCPDCGEEMAIEVRDGSVSGEGLLHFAVPAAHWWDDIGFN